MILQVLYRLDVGLGYYGWVDLGWLDTYVHVCTYVASYQLAYLHYMYLLLLPAMMTAVLLVLYISGVV